MTALFQSLLTCVICDFESHTIATICTKHNSLSGWNCDSRAKRDIKNCYFSNPNDQNMNLPSKFEGDPTVNESKISVLPE